MGRGFFVAPRASYNRDTVNVFVDEQIASEYRRTIRDIGADLGFTSGRSLEARVGYARQRVDASVRVGAPTVPEVTGAQGFWRSQIVFDNQDNPVVPGRGLYARAELRKFTSTARVALPEPYATNPEPDDLLSGEATGSVFVPVWGKGRFFVAAAGGSSFGDATVVNAFTLGGPLALSALQTDELRGSNFVLGHAGYFHEVARIFEGAAGRLYLGTWIENGATFERLAQAQIRTNISGGLIMETVLGPAFLVGSVGTDGRHRIYIGLGPVFRQ
jgi:outer membrane protein assembly factor BamA